MPIHYDLDDHVVTITIDRPARRNALDLEHFDALAAAWKRFRDDPDAWVAIVTGTDDAFCAGGDLRDYIPLLTAAGPDDRERFRSGTEAVLRDLDIYKPIVAAVNGPCVAGGMELLNGTDIRVACPEAVFGMLEPRQGIFASGGTTARLPRQLAWPTAMEFLLTAEPIPATRALELGLLNEIVPRHQLVDRARLGGAHHRECAARHRGDEGECAPRPRRRDHGGGVPHRGAPQPEGARQQRRARGAARLRREAAAALERDLSRARRARRPRSGASSSPGTRRSGCR